MKWLTKTVVWLLDAVLVILMILLVGNTFFQVINRFVLQYPIAWTEEAARYLAIWISLLGAARCSYMDTHMRVEVIFDLLPDPVKRVLLTVGDVLSLWMMTVVVHQAFRILPIVGRQIAAASRIRMYWIYLAVPVSGLLMIVFLVRHLYGIWSKREVSPSIGTAQGRGLSE